jgi:hypothetical protein
MFPVVEWAIFDRDGTYCSLSSLQNIRSIDTYFFRNLSYLYTYS